MACNKQAIEQFYMPSCVWCLLVMSLTMVPLMDGDLFLHAFNRVFTRVHRKSQAEKHMKLKEPMKSGCDFIC